MTPEEKKEYNRKWREQHPDYNKKYLKKWRKSPNYEMVKMKLRKSGFHIKKNAERKEYLKEYQKQRWINKVEILNNINKVLGYEDFVSWKFIPNFSHKYAISDTGVVFDIKNNSIIPLISEGKIKVVYLHHNNKLTRVKVPYAILYSFSKHKSKKRFYIGYKDGDWRNVALHNLKRVYPIDELLNSQFYADLKALNFQVGKYFRIMKKNIDFSEIEDIY